MQFNRILELLFIESLNAHYFFNRDQFLVLLINGVCISCWESNGTTMCGMMMWDRKQSNHILRLLFKHGVWASLPVRPHCRMPYESYANRILVADPLDNWSRPPGRPCTIWMKTTQQDLKSVNLSLNEAIDMAQNRALWRLMSTFVATHS